MNELPMSSMVRGIVIYFALHVQVFVSLMQI
jgi:hypothetical protein